MPISILTPVEYNSKKDFTESIIEAADRYFFFGGEKAVVLSEKTFHGEERVILKNEEISLTETILKGLSYIIFIIPLFVFGLKAALRSNHIYHVVSAKDELEKGMILNNQEIKLIKVLIPSVIKKAQHQMLIHLKGEERNIHKFKMSGSSDFIYYISDNQAEIQRLFDDMVEAKETCIKEGFADFVVPRAKQFELCDSSGKQYYFIAQESLERNFQRNG
jgi:Family of unknown function (DUF648)